LKDSLESKSNEKKEDFDKMHFYLNLSYLDVQIISNLVNGDSLLNKRQCQDLSCKLSKTVQNVKRLVSHCGTLAGFLCHAMEIFYRHVEEAKLLVENCCNKDLCIDSIFQIQNLFCPMVKMLYQQVEKGKLLVESRRSRVLCAKFIFQVQNENSFQEILLDVSLCYNAIYEQAKSTCLKWGTLPEDLCQYDVLIPASNSNVHQDQQEIKKRLEDIVDPHFCFGPLNSYFVLPQTLHINQCLARYLLLKLNFISQGSQSKLLNGSSAIFWKKDTEPFETWGSDKFGGKGAGASGVYITNFLSIPCAKKIFDEGFEKTFLKEMGILIHLNHPRIVNFICCGNDQGPGNRFIALELMNKSLSTLIKEQNEVPFSLPVVLDIIVQMARGMRYLHDQKIAHRDLKPDNVMVNTLIFPHLPIHFNVKLIDFGVSKAKIEVSSAITVTAVGIGTSKYRAPELHPKRPLELERKACWFKADVYCFAMTCIHLLTLKMPFDDIDNMGSEAAYMALQNGRRPEPPKECPKELAALLRMCWHIDPSRRPSFIEICSELEAIRFKGPSKLSTFDQRKDSLGGRKIELMGQNYIDLKLQGSSLIPKGNKKEKIPDVMPEVNSNDAISVSSCAFGHTLQFLPESRCDSTTQFICGFCQNQGYGEIYHCQTCKSDIHTACAENKDVVKVFFHEDPLHLLIQNHSLGDSDAICGFCDESLEANSEWVYRCELCKYDVHALCTKYSRKIIHSTHPHELTLVRYAVRKRLVSNQSLFCKGCKGDLKGYYYTCSKKSCDYNLHPFCAILPTSLPCLFDSSHRLSLDTEPRPFQPFQPFQCGKCATSGNSWLYHCDQCLTDIHLECIEDMKEEELIDDWEKLYDESMAGYYNKDAAAKVIIFSKLLDRLLGNQTETQDLEARTQATPSSSRPQPGWL
jgi:serine/threonine protein kinase